MTGYGGYGSSYSQAVNRYQERYNAPPAAVKNRRTLRTTGGIRNAANSKARRSSNNSNRATGSGVGSSTLRSSGKNTKRLKRPSSFGSSGVRRPRRSFSRGRRR